MRQLATTSARGLLPLLGLFGLVVTAAPAQAQLPATVEFNRDIRPILSDHCFQCHGPDKANLKAKLRLDSEDSAKLDRGGYHAIAAGDPGKSEVYLRLTAKNEKERMPPASSGRKLTRRQIDLVKRWIEQGAKWQKHWSLIAPARPVPPKARDSAWLRNPIDAFILARLEQEGLKPAPEADRTTLLRRVSLDLTGLPPTPAEVDAFLADRSPDAYEKAVDRLLASPRYGERMAARWIDAARYADTNGYQTDGERIMWRWRDWVIDAFNSNMPFDQFTVEQIAGDMLPDPTLEQQIATGFNRNHRGNSEGGVIPEEYAVEYVVDRVDTTSTVWLGLTAGCAKCHDHKYDPITQKEFYRLFAYFNNVPERGKAIKYGNSPPMIRAPTREQQAREEKLQQEYCRAVRRYEKVDPRSVLTHWEWERKPGIGPNTQWWVTDGLMAYYPFDGEEALKNPAAKAVCCDGTPAYVRGPLGQAAAFDGKRFFDAGNAGAFGFFDKFTLSAWVYPDGPRGGTILSRMADTPRGEGYSILLEDGKVHVNLVKRWLDDAIRVQTENALAPGRWYHLLVAYDGSRVAEGIQVWIDCVSQKLQVNLDDLNQSFKTEAPFRIGAGNGPGGRFHGYVDDVRIYNRRLAPYEVAILGTPETINQLLELIAFKSLTEPQSTKLREYYLANHAPEATRLALRQVRSLARQLVAFQESLPTTMVMEEMPTPRDTFVLLRGEYDKKGEKVTPGLPASLPPLPAEAPNNRLGFARWLVDPSNPLTARVQVNRYWQMYFGTGLVKTVEDLGSQGEWPSHPELLDWLATEFIRSGWDVKAMQKLIVTSAAYRQSSRATPALLQRDPDNRLLARGPRVRLPAGTIRDQALAVSGLLVERLGGPSVKPYQPDGLWKDLAGEDYVGDKGDKLYRRSLYTFWKRTIAPPAMMTFDAANRETCVVRETRTNTPLQALNLMNDVTYVEAARVLAQRVLKEGHATAGQRLTLMFRLATARPPRPAELKILREGLEHHLGHYRQDRPAALQLLSTGESPRDERLEVGDLAAYTAVASLILNLDEVICKE